MRWVWGRQYKSVLNISVSNCHFDAITSSPILLMTGYYISCDVEIFEQ